MKEERARPQAGTRRVVGRPAGSRGERPACDLVRSRTPCRVYNAESARFILLCLPTFFPIARSFIAMSQRVYNFSSGPAVLPLPVLEQAQREMLCVPGVGCSAMEISTRSPWFEGVLAETEANFRKLLKIPDGYKVLFLQGGARLQFSMIPINILRGTNKAADYVVTGSWGTMAQTEAQREGKVRTASTSKATNFDRLPKKGEL